MIRDSSIDKFRFNRFTNFSFRTYLFFKYMYNTTLEPETVTGQGCPDALTPCPDLQVRAGQFFFLYSALPALQGNPIRARAGQGKIILP
jgi:hypothetical protein